MIGLSAIRSCGNQKRSDEDRTYRFEESFLTSCLIRYRVEISESSEEFSGTCNLRVPRSSHRTSVEGTEREGVSLNQYVGTLLAARDADA